MASARWRGRQVGIAQARWHCLPVADTLAEDVGARFCRGGVRGALRGESPRTREGRNGPTAERAVDSGQLPVARNCREV